MSAKLLEGAPIADKIKAEVIAAIADLGKTPKLAAILATDNKGAEFYAKSQGKACEEVGIDFELFTLSPDATQEAIEAQIATCNADPGVTGIILLMPVPEGVDGRKLQRAIDPKKDVDGVHPANLGAVVQGSTTLAPCTAQAVLALVQASQAPVFTDMREAAGKGADIVVVGHSEIVGKPSALLLLDKFATVTVCHIGTKDLKSYTQKADVLVVAVGKAGLIKGEHIKPGAIVIDVGINRVKTEDGKSKIVGDVLFDEAVEIASEITPVPGGVGTVTTAMLLKNIIDAARLQG
ncbi:MAG: bifunctional 5,10-methylenetetrahydrofolate dehydrogenase/5,10-methenyltetrahydrofolate cyclohydrolase [Bacteroidota bacterium]